MPIRPGTRLGDRYEILSVLGGGSLGAAYLAEDTRLFGLRVVVKIVGEADLSSLKDAEGFTRTAEFLSALNHRNIPRVVDFFTEQGVHYIVTQFVDGETLRQRMHHRLPRIGEAIDIATQVTDALSSAHAAGILHRSIKPENILLARDGSVQVLDFGFTRLTARKLDPWPFSNDVPRNEQGAIIDTVAYLSPERIRGKGLDVTSDIWSLGVVLYEMVTGRLPFESSNISEVTALILDKSPSPLTDFAPQAPADLQVVVSKTLKKNPRDRYQTANDFSRALQGIKKSIEPRDQTISFPSPITVPQITAEYPRPQYTERVERVEGNVMAHRSSKRAKYFVPVLILAGVTLLAIAAIAYIFQPKKDPREEILRLQIGQAGQTAQNALEERFTAIEPIRVELPKSETSITGYDADEVIDAVRIGEVVLTQGLADDDLAGLRAYVLQRYPIPTSADLEKIAKTYKDNDRVLVDEAAKNYVFKNALQFISRIRGLSEEGRLSIDLTISSNPDPATYDMWTISGPHRTTTTPSTIKNIYRGIYLYKVTKAGYKSVEATLDLVDGNGQKLDCSLYTTEERDGPHPCKLQ